MNRIEELKALEARATKGPMKANDRTPTSNPQLLGPDGIHEFAVLASFYWGCHPSTTEAEAKMVDEVESLVELLAALRNAAPALLAVAEAAEKVDKMYHTSPSLYFQDATVEEAQKHRDGLMRDLRTALANLKGAEA